MSPLQTWLDVGGQPEVTGHHAIGVCLWLERSNIKITIMKLIHNEPIFLVNLGLENGGHSYSSNKLITNQDNICDVDTKTNGFYRDKITLCKTPKRQVRVYVSSPENCCDPPKCFISAIFFQVLFHRAWLALNFWYCNLIIFPSWTKCHHNLKVLRWPLTGIWRDRELNNANLHAFHVEPIFDHAWHAFSVTGCR